MPDVLKRPPYLFVILCAALVTLVIIDAAGLSISADTRRILEGLAWTIGPALGWTGHAALSPTKE